MRHRLPYRRRAAYEVTPIGAEGPEKDRATVVLGPDLDGDYRAKWEREAQLRVVAQRRLNAAMRTLAAIAAVNPHLQLRIERDRERIFEIKGEVA